MKFTYWLTKLYSGFAVLHGCLRDDPDNQDSCEFVLVNLAQLSPNTNTASTQAHEALEQAFSNTDKSHLAVANYLKDMGYVEIENFDVVKQNLEPRL